MKSKKMKTVVIIAAVLLVILAAGYFTLEKFARQKVAEITITNPVLADINDGDYEGEFTSEPVSVKVKVTVNNHSITAIEILEHRNGLGKKAEAITQRIINEQKLDVQMISGATYSSRVIEKAVENALAKGN